MEDIQGGASIIDENNPSRWLSYINDSLIETTISQYSLINSQVNKPVLLRRLFQLGCSYSSQILSYSKIFEELDETVNTATLAYYLEFLSGAGMLTGLKNYFPQKFRQESSNPKFSVLNTALMAAQTFKSYHEAKKDRSYWGRLTESAVGAYLLNSIRGTRIEVFYWREGDKEVDFILQQGDSLTAIEVKSGLLARRHSGIEAFVEKYQPSRVLLVGENGIPVSEFLQMPIDSLVG